MIYKRWLVLSIVCILSYSHHSEASVVASFTGQIDLVAKELSASIELPTQPAGSFLKEGLLSLKVWKMADNTNRLTLGITNFSTTFCKVSTQIEMAVAPAKNNAEIAWEGQLWSQYSLVNLQPVPEASGKFTINHNNQVRLSDFSMGTIQSRGTLDLRTPFGVDLSLFIRYVPMQDFINFWTGTEIFDGSGDVSGEIKAAGTLDKVFLKGRLHSGEGFVENLTFDSLGLNIEGTYPHMQILPSTVQQGSAHYSFSGPIDLADQKNFEKQVKDLTIAPLVSNSKSDLEWTIKSLKHADSTSTEIKYIRQKGIKSNAEDTQTEMLGIERKMEF